MLWSIYSVYIVIYLAEVSNNSTNHPELHTKPTVSESCEISDWTVTRCEDGQIWLVNQTNQQRFLDFWELVPPPPHHHHLFFLCHMEPDSLSHDCTVAATSHQALFSSGNHLCPYLCSLGSCYDNSLCLISLLFMEWHLNDHSVDQWNSPIWIKKYRKV